MLCKVQKAVWEPQRFPRVGVPGETMLGTAPAPGWSLGATLWVGERRKKSCDRSSLVMEREMVGREISFGQLLLLGRCQAVQISFAGTRKRILFIFFFLSSIIISGNILCLAPVLIPRDRRMCMRVSVHSMQPPAVSHALPALLPPAVEPATRTSRLLPSRRLCTSPGLPPHWRTSASFESD